MMVWISRSVSARRTERFRWLGTFVNKVNPVLSLQRTDAESRPSGLVAFGLVIAVNVTAAGFFFKYAFQIT